jgi:hypothetical protein
MAGGVADYPRLGLRPGLVVAAGPKPEAKAGPGPARRLFLELRSATWVENRWEKSGKKAGPRRPPNAKLGRQGREQGANKGAKRARKIGH